MNISFTDKLRITASVYSIQNLLPTVKKRLALFIRPLDLTRYTEFAYLQKFIKEKRLSNMKILDVSSPHLMAYILSKENNVIKTNIDISEKEFIKENMRLTFMIEDGTHLSFKNETFDMVYSVSVIEHIYQNYLVAVTEMLRVTKPKGYVYLTFPVSKNYQEEWVDGLVYEHQFRENNKTFFQYRFGEKEVSRIIDTVGENTILYKDIFWEKTDGIYNRAVQKLHNTSRGTYLQFARNALVNLVYGFTLFPKIPSKDFTKSKDFGNMHILIQKS